MSESDSRIRHHDHRMLYLWIFVVIAFALSSVRGELNKHSIESHAHAQALYNYHQCERSAINATKLNRTTRAQIRFLSGFVKTSPNPDSLRAYIKIYEDAILIVPECGIEP